MRPTGRKLHARPLGSTSAPESRTFNALGGSRGILAGAGVLEPVVPGIRAKWPTQRTKAVKGANSPYCPSKGCSLIKPRTLLLLEFPLVTLTTVCCCPDISLVYTVHKVPGAELW